MTDRIVHIDEITTRTYTHAEYDALDGVNWTRLKELRRSPLHFQHRLTVAPGDTDVLKLGRLVHTAVFEPHRVGRDFAVWDGERRAGKEWERFKELHWRETIVRAQDLERACAIRDAVRASPLVARYLAVGEAEKVLQWKDRRTGVAMKARLDWLGPEVILDLKTARNTIDQRAFAADAYRLGYFHQLELYRRGVAAVRGKGEGPPALLVAVEPEPPHDVAVYRLGEDSLHFVGEELNALLDQLVKCRAEGRWPGRFEAEQELEIPRWAFPSLDDMEVTEPAWLEGA